MIYFGDKLLVISEVNLMYHFESAESDDVFVIVLYSTMYMHSAELYCMFGYGLNTMFCINIYTYDKPIQ